MWQKPHFFIPTGDMMTAIIASYVLFAVLAMRRKSMGVGRAVRFGVVLLLLVVVPSLALAQGPSGSIAGVVKGATGAVLPRVTVAVASPAVIEKVRTPVTDAQGAYKISPLRPC